LNAEKRERPARRQMITVFAMPLGHMWSKTPGRSGPGLPVAAAFVTLALAGIALHALEKRQIGALSQRSLAAASLARASQAVGMAPYAVLTILEYDDSIEAGRQAPVVFLDAMREARSALDEAVQLAPDKAAQIRGFKKRFEEMAEKANPALAIGNSTPGLTRGAALSASDLAQLASGAQLAAEPDAWRAICRTSPRLSRKGAPRRPLPCRMNSTLRC
jgi:hypothetical protein